MGKSILYDLGYLEAAVEELKSYVLSEELFWTLSGYSSSTNEPFPKLTLGGVLLALTRSRSRADSIEDKERVESFARQLETFSTKWRVAWEAKVAREFLSRLHQWANYLNEVQGEPREYAVYYQYEIRLRVIAELLKKQIHDSDDEESDFLRKLDWRLQAQFIPGDFIWDEELSSGFPREEFWFLWGEIRN